MFGHGSCVQRITVLLPRLPASSMSPSDLLCLIMLAAGIESTRVLMLMLMLCLALSRGLVQLSWGVWVTLIGFLVMIKPIREAIPLFMLQFNGLDRPEVRGGAALDCTALHGIVEIFSW